MTLSGNRRVIRCLPTPRYPCASAKRSPLVVNARAAFGRAKIAVRPNRLHVWFVRTMEGGMTKSVSATLEAAAARCGCDDGELTRFAQHLQALPSYQAARINPFAFAEAAGISSERALDLFVHGARLGLFDLEWGMVCPLCGAITHSVAELDRVADDLVHCSLCNRDADAVLDDTIEVSFAYAPAGTILDLHRDFAAYQHYYTSSSYPYRDQWRNYHERHTVADAKLEPGEKATLPLRLQAGEAYRLLCLDTHSGAELQVTEQGASAENARAIALSLSDAGFSQSQVSLPAGDATLALANQTEQPVWCRILRIDMNDIMAIMQQGPPQFGRRLTGKHLLNNQAFRDSFRDARIGARPEAQAAQPNPTVHRPEGLDSTLRPRGRSGRLPAGPRSLRGS